ncbi:hypothetical protein EVAR_68070_1 [Eumeta japonica]|uniref:Uncharacterized protein n=1 Tax=Eumeta variegata TaxID=151549 RepID=A0A4C1ZYJ4_EUMVA|nr:hypothetical protein EVAR_68070_1 [Eumeta japonica]
MSSDHPRYFRYHVVSSAAVRFKDNSRRDNAIEVRIENLCGCFCARCRGAVTLRIDADEPDRVAIPESSDTIFDSIYRMEILGTADSARPLSEATFHYVSGITYKGVVQRGHKGVLKWITVQALSVDLENVGSSPFDLNLAFDFNPDIDCKFEYQVQKLYNKYRLETDSSDKVLHRSSERLRRRLADFRRHLPTLRTKAPGELDAPEPQKMSVLSLVIFFMAYSRGKQQGSHRRVDGHCHPCTPATQEELPVAGFLRDDKKTYIFDICGPPGIDIQANRQPNSVVHLLVSASFEFAWENAQQSFSRLRPVFDDEVPYDYLWFAKLKRGRVNLSDEFRGGRSFTAAYNKNVDALLRMIKTDRHVTYHEIWASSPIKFAMGHSNR